MMSQILSVRFSLQKEGFTQVELIHALNCRNHQGLEKQTLESRGGIKAAIVFKASEFLL